MTVSREPVQWGRECVCVYGSVCMCVCCFIKPAVVKQLSVVEKKSLLYHGVAFAHFVHVLEKREREGESHGVDLTVGLIVSQGLHDMQSDSVALVSVLPAALHCSDCISMKSIHSNENHAGLKETHHRKILLLRKNK